jgi:hypothetical protein
MPSHIMAPCGLVVFSRILLGLMRHLLPFATTVIGAAKPEPD